MIVKDLSSDGWDFFPEDFDLDFEEPPEIPENCLICECGAWKVYGKNCHYSRHYKWCKIKEFYETIGKNN